MKILTDIARYLVGGLFIFSGLIKINDPVGTAIKLEEYFAVFAGDIAPFFSIFEPYALVIGIFLNVLEVVLGIALIIKWRVKFTITLLSILIVFFTFLTFYSAYFNKVTDCGCFGDAIKLTPWESFTKDVILLVLIGFLLIFRNKIKDSTFAAKNIIIICVTALSVLLCIYAIRHLPFIDFRAYKVGVNIPEAMTAKESPKFQYTFEKEGETIKSYQYLTEKEGYKLVSHEITNPDISTPKITDFAVWNESGDKTKEMLSGKKLWIIAYNIEEASTEGLIDINSLISRLPGDITPIILTSSSAEGVLKVKAERGLTPDFYYGDATVLKTIIRSNPGLVLVEDGTVLAKWHYNDVPDPSDLSELLR
ncbi:DoxX family protein [Marivirga sp. S37H4]|uniref:DoxX family protein n=1 Tax=Marivirga aurantiaca TaxID=2802615 RepID=A0A935CA17_9BACT|nr:BT_3928 family protein [Marivirga aurantiaca]MBK6264568.1 DoxX family protein [Marivirga aurantiaca]